MTQCTTDAMHFKSLGRRNVVADFQGGTLTSDGGALLLDKTDQAIGLMAKVAECFVDYRDPNRIEHTVEELIRQRVFGLALGYEDTIVITYSLCSIDDVPAALAEMRRVLRKGGRLLFCEHGRAADASVLRWQKLLDPLWMRLAGGCRLGRDIPAMLRDGGFQIRHLNSRYISGWRPVSFNYWGVAT